MRTRMQQGGTTEEQVMQLIQMYAQITGDDPQAIVNELQQMSPEDQGMAIQQIGQAVESYMSDQQGQQMPQGQQMARGGSYSGTYDAATGSYFSYGGSYGGGRLRIAQDGMEVPPRPESQDYPDYPTFKAADDEWMLTYGEGAINVPEIEQQLGSMPMGVGYENPAANILASGSPMAPIPVPTAVVAATPGTAKEDPSQYGYSIVNYLNSKGLPSSYNTRKDIAKILNISNYRGNDTQNIQMLETLLQNPTMLQTIIGGGGKKTKGGGNSTAKAINNIRKKAQASGAIPGGSSSGSSFAPPVVTPAPVTPFPVVAPDSTGVVVDSFGNIISDTGKVVNDTGKIKNPFDFDLTDSTGTRPDTIEKPKKGEPVSMLPLFAGVVTGAGLAYLGALQQGPIRAKAVLDVISKNPNFIQASDNMKSQMLEKATADVEGVYKWYKKLPKEQKAIVDNLDAMEIEGYLPGENIGDPGARADALFAQQDAILERQALSRLADQEATNAINEAELETDIANETALRRSGVKPTTAKRIVKSQRNTRAMLNAEPPAPTAPAATPSLRQRLMANIKRRGAVAPPTGTAAAPPRVEAPRVEGPSTMSRFRQGLGAAGRFTKALFKEIGKREYGGAYLPDYSMAYGGGYHYNSGGDFCVDPMTGEPIDCETLRMMQMNSSEPYYRMNPNTGRINTDRIRMNPYREQQPNRNPYLGEGRAMWSNDPERLRNAIQPIPTTYPKLRPGQNPLQQMYRPIPKGMYGMGMAKGGQMPQWLAERRFAAAGNQDMMSDYGYQQGGVVEVSETDLPQVLQQLQQGGYQFEIMR